MLSSTVIAGRGRRKVRKGREKGGRKLGGWTCVCVCVGGGGGGGGEERRLDRKSHP